MQIRINTDLACGLFGLAFAALFWSQRGTVGFMSSVFPDTVLVILAVIAAALVLRGVFVSRAEMFQLEGGLRVLIVVGIFAGWWLGITHIGFVTTSVPLFVALSLLLIGATRRVGARDVVLATAVALVLSLGFFLIFTQGLGIRPFRAPFI